MRTGLAVVALLCLLAPARARAQMPKDSARASQRTAAEILGHRVQLADGRVVEAVLIRRNEIVYLGAKPRPGGGVEFSVVPPAQRARASVHLALLADAGHSWLRVESGLDAPLRYRVASPGHARRAIAQGQGVVGPRHAARTPLHGSPAELLVFDFEIVAAPARAASEVEDAPGYLAVSITGAAHHNTLGALEAELDQNGHGGVGSLQPLVGLAFDLAAGRVQVGLIAAALGSRDFRRRSDGETFSLGQVAISLEAGYALLRTRRLVVFPALGLRVGDLHLDLEYDEPALFPERLRDAPGRGEQVRTNLFGALLCLGASYRWPLFENDTAGLLLTARVGYHFQLHQWSWVRASPTLPELGDAPSIDTSGAFARMGFGFYAEL